MQKTKRFVHQSRCNQTAAGVSIARSKLPEVKRNSENYLFFLSFAQFLGVHANQPANKKHCGVLQLDGKAACVSSALLFRLFGIALQLLSNDKFAFGVFDTTGLLVNLCDQVMR